MKLPPFARLVAAALLLTGWTGCAHTKVIVRDAASGDKLPGARVVTEADDYVVSDMLTDEFGEAIAKVSPDARNISVSKPGYERIRSGLPTHWPMKVHLERLAR